jgi:ABC-type branched-subunit amino acid transport system ATPase component
MIFKLENISFSYNSSATILENLNLTLDSGNIYALMGANGSGKTTLFNIISGFIKQSRGKVYLNNENINRLSPFKRNRKGIGRTFQDLRIIKNITVEENIGLAFKGNLSDTWYNNLFNYKRIKNQQVKFNYRAEEILTELHLTEVKNQLADNISYGQQKLLTIACCIANDAEILFLDEPVAGVNPIYRQQLTELLMRLKEKGKTILLIEHNTEFIDQVADSILFLSQGELKLYSNLSSLKKDPEVIKAYM